MTRRRSPCSDPSGDVVLLDWKFNAWAKYDNWSLDDGVGAAVASITGLRREEPRTQDDERIVLEGGGIDVNGDGLLLVTEEWLLSDVAGAEPGTLPRGLRADLRDVVRHRPDDLAG